MSSKLKTIYHIADVHIRNVKRHKEYRQVFEKMFEEIRKRGTEDAIIYLAGDIAHAKLEMSPELVNEISWLFKECAKTCPTILITGNHDCNMNNMDRMDVLTPLVDALELENFYYLRDTQVYSIGGVDFSVFSILDNKNNWITADKLFGNKKIALFHGPVDNSQTDIGYVVSSRHFTTDIFDGFDLALLGDIHKRQEMISPKGCKVVYAGSLIQQNFGETLDRHGFLAWDLDTMTYEEIDIKNDYGYYTMDIDNGKVPVVNDMPKHPRLRVRLSNTDTADTKKVITEIKMRYGVEDFTIIRTDSLSKKKTGDRDNKLEFENISDINYQNSLINEYVERMMPFVDKKDLAQLERINRDVNSRIVHEDTLRNIQWKPVRFEFSNMFSYGENNKIDFTKLNGLMGLFAPNAQGKSSIFDAISFCLYDKSSRAFKAQNILNNRKTDFRCYLHFQVNGVDYHIERTAKTINKGKNVKVDVNFWYIDLDNQKVSLNGTERRDTNSVIEQYVGKYEDFVLTALSLQGNNSIFIDKSQSERKDLLAQFMGLNVFDKLYETATEDIKEVSVLIKNFKKTDFTTELADKANELKDKKGELKELEIELNKLNGGKGGLDNSILELSRNLTPIDSNLDLPTLEEKRKDINEKLQSLEVSYEAKEKNIETYTQKINELSQSIEEKKQSNGLDIEIVYSNYQKEQKALVEAESVYSNAKVYLKSAEEKIKHLDNHQYDPNCKFCCDNEFVKDAMKAKEALPELQQIVKDALIDATGIQQTLDRWEGVEEQYNEWIDLTGKHSQAKGILRTAEAELKTLESREELLETQLDKVEEDIETYYEKEETIESTLFPYTTLFRSRKSVV